MCIFGFILKIMPKEIKKNINVKQDVRLTFAYKPKMQVMARRILAMAFSKIKNEDSFNQDIIFKVSEIGDYIPSLKSGIYGKAEMGVEELLKTAWKFKKTDGSGFYGFPLLKYGHILNGTIILRLNKSLIPYFINLRRYTLFSLNEFMRLTSANSQTLYELLSNYFDTGFFYMLIGEYRERMSCQDKYPKTSALIKNTLKSPIKEMATTSLAFKYGLDIKTGKDGNKETKGIYFNHLYTNKNRELYTLIRKSSLCTSNENYILNDPQLIKI